jgi:hypothetical protein
MKALRNLMLVAVVVGTMTVMGARSFAGPLPSFPEVWNPGDFVMGQSTLASTDPDYLGSIYDLEIDWVVMFLGPAPAGNPFGIPAGTPVWGYYYQIENSSTTVVGSFTITTPGPPFVAATSVGADLDAGTATDPLNPIFTIPAHNVAGETEAATVGTAFPITGVPALSLTSVTYSFQPPPFGPGKMPTGWESEILIAYALVPPTYGRAGALDDTPPSPWASRPYGEPVPVPSPEPAVTMLLGIGTLLGAVMLRRRK